MSDERLFLDTVFIQALLNKRDQYYVQARVFLPRVRVAASVWVTEAVLVEVGNALSAVNRPAAVQFIQQCYNTAKRAGGSSGYAIAQPCVTALQ
jgi:uncharacterized protein